MSETQRNYAPVLVMLLGLLALGLSWLLMGHDLQGLLNGGLQTDHYSIGQMLVLHSGLPRMTVAIMSGLALGLSGAVLQLALRNPLASPTTMGVSSGAYLALVIASLYFPSVLEHGREAVALTGAGLTALMVFGLMARGDFSPVSLILAGLIVSLYCGALAYILVLLNERYLATLFIWGAGSLSQQGWGGVQDLLPQLSVVLILCALLVRPFSLLILGDSSASSLGVSPRTIRFFAVALAIAAAALVTSAVGVIGFVGLVAPMIVRLCGARRVVSQIVWGALMGAVLLWFTDAGIQLLSGTFREFVPTGAVTALLGAPLLLVLIPRMKFDTVLQKAELPPVWRAGSVQLSLVIFSVLAVLVLVMAIGLGRGEAGLGWSLDLTNTWEELYQWRVPRVLSAFGAGILLALSGLILQRLTGNVMASPEVLGINAGAMIGVAVCLFLVGNNAGTLTVGALFGASAVLAALFAFGRKSGFQPERMILIGVALGALIDALISALAASGDLRAVHLLRIMSGSTYGVSLEAAVVALIMGVVFLVPLLWGARGMELLALGDRVSGALGMNVRRTRFVLFAVAAFLTAGATVLIGPLSFIGLMAPHVARAMGIWQVRAQLLASALIGGTLLVLADWIGRMLDYPYEMPAGLLSALVGTPLLLILLSRQNALARSGSA
ncbi:Fe(3+)-hydroxamate ABC transporter permease FhuB [Kiloniella sp. b19]|uniref:Fe(3+)-hydroxamate ABC transporter permease FhuB n=1 Tax=Kiloniella sp. GXU_MW_B19 TaxID=3141326 RepID=UPI0031D2DC72